jgi:hypothetical protein
MRQDVWSGKEWILLAYSKKEEGGMRRFLATIAIFYEGQIAVLPIPRMCMELSKRRVFLSSRLFISSKNPVQQKHDE